MQRTNHSILWKTSGNTEDKYWAEKGFQTNEEDLGVNTDPTLIYLLLN